jgi:Zn-dependent peptidase ImmA (M78 family)
MTASFERSDTAAMAWRQDGIPQVIVDREAGSGRQRYAMAHMLGHWILHLPEHAEGTGWRDTVAALYPEDPATLPAEEQDANAFACALLMPRWAWSPEESWAAPQLAEWFAVPYLVARRTLHGSDER